MSAREPSAASERRSTTETAEVLAMTPRDALSEVERYIRASTQKRAFGKTRVQAALRVLEDHLGR